MFGAIVERSVASKRELGVFFLYIKIEPITGSIV